MNVELSQFSRSVVGDYALYSDSVLFRAGTFPERIVKGKPLTITASDIDTMVKNFSSPIPGNILHSDYLDGIGSIISLRRNGNELHGDVLVDLWFDEGLTKKNRTKERQISVELDPETFDSVRGFALVTKPRIHGAMLMSEEVSEMKNEYFKKSPHNTSHGQRSMQLLHDMSATAGAICSPSEMTSKHEAKGFQAIHDMTLEHGASCDYSAYYSEKETEISNSMFTPEQFTEFLNRINPFSASTNTAGDTVDVDTATGTQVTDPSGVVYEDMTIEDIDVTKTDQFIAKQKEIDDLTAKFNEIDEQRKKSEEDAKALFTETNEKSVDKLISDGKFDPKDRDMLLTKRASGPALFDEMAEMLPVKDEFKVDQPTVRAEDVRDKMLNPEATEKQKRIDTDKNHLSRITGGL